MRIVSKFLLGFVALAASVVPATAAIITVDVSGVFGGSSPSGHPLLVPAGTAFSVNFTYDSAAPGVADSSGVLTRYAFGSGATVTIGGITQSGGFTLEAVDIAGSGIFVGLFDLGAGAGAGAGEVRGLTLLSDFGPGISAGQLLPSDPAFFTRHAFHVQAYDTLASPPPGIDPTVRISYSDGPVLATATAVPESGTWTMMIMGFGIVGAGLRQRSSHKRLSPRTR